MLQRARPGTQDAAVSKLSTKGDAPRPVASESPGWLVNRLSVVLHPQVSESKGLGWAGGPEHLPFLEDPRAGPHAVSGTG